MTRAEYVQFLLDKGCLIQKQYPNGMWIMFNEATNKRAAIPATNPALSANVCRVCDALGVELPDEPEIYSAKAGMLDFQKSLNQE